MSGELDFAGKIALVVGGSSGIGNGIAQAFRVRGAAVHVWGTRASAADYAGTEGSDLAGLSYDRVDVADFASVDAYQPPLTRSISWSSARARSSTSAASSACRDSRAWWTSTSTA